MRLGDIVDGRRQAGADRPDRLVGDHHRRVGGGRRHGTGNLARQDVERRADLALGPRLADADDRDEAGPPRGLGLRQARCRRSRHGRCGARSGRRSRARRRHPSAFRRRCRRYAAPLSCQWQSWPPLLTGVRDRISEARDRSVAGTQSSASVSASRPLMKPWPIAISSCSEALVPFIFQLPATSGRMAEIIGIRPWRQSGLASCALPKSSHKAIDSGPEGRYCPSITHQARRKMPTRAIGTRHARRTSHGRRNLGRQTAAVHAGDQLCDLGHFRTNDRRLRIVACHHGRRHDGVGRRITAWPTTARCR